MDAETEVKEEYGRYGVTYMLIEDGMIVDTYAPWSGDQRPEWMKGHEHE